MTTKQTEIVVYYIAHKEMCIQELKQCYQNIPGFIEVVFHKTMDVIDLQSTVPRHEYATHLFLHACREAKIRGINIVNLDDCSDHHRSEHNIYTKLGMEYEDKDSGPEMMGDISKIIKYQTKTESPKIYTLNL